jgi:hypothetical protein
MHAPTPLQRRRSWLPDPPPLGAFELAVQSFGGEGRPQRRWWRRTAAELARAALSEPLIAELTFAPAWGPSVLGTVCA